MLLLLIQGFVSVRIGIMESRSQKDLGIAGIIAAVLVIKGATWAFAAGVVLTALLYGKDFFQASRSNPVPWHPVSKKSDSNPKNNQAHENKSRRITPNEAE